MPQYVDVVVGGITQKFVQLDDSVLVPVNVSLSLEGGTLVKLPDAQIDSLKTPTLPTEFPLPDSQVSALQVVAVSNLPSAYNINNFPSGFACNNLPAAYPLPANQETMLNAIKTWTDGLDKGSGVFGVNTLRAVLPTNQPELPTRLPTVAMAPINISSAGDNTILTPATNKALRISAIAFTAPSLVNVTFKQGSTGLSGAMSVADFVAEFSRELALAQNQPFVINLGSAVALSGYVCWREE